MIIRQENEKEYNDIYELVKIGFETAKVTDGNEQNFVVELRQGVGGKLIKESLKKAKEMGYTSVFLVGDPAYYSRYDFQPSVKFGIKNTNDITDEYVMAQEIVEDALQKIQGTITF